MEYRELGRTGLTVSSASFGTAPLGDMFGTASAVALGLVTGGDLRIGSGHPATPPIRAAAERARTAAQEQGVDLSMLANQYAIQRSGCPTTLIGTADPDHLDQAVRAAETPLDEGVLGAVLAAIGDARGQSWTSGRPENN